MARPVGIKSILAAHNDAGPYPATFHPDAAVFIGEKGLAALAQCPGGATGLNPNKVFVSAGEGADLELIRRCEEEAARKAVIALDPYRADLPSALGETFVSGGGLAAAVGEGSPLALVENLVCKVDAAAAGRLWREGAFELTAPAGVHRVVVRGTLAPAVTSLDVGQYLAHAFGLGGLEGALLEISGPTTERWDPEEGREAAVAAMAGTGAAAAMVAVNADPAADAIYEYDFSPLRPSLFLWREGEVAASEVEDAEGYPLDAVVLGPGIGAQGLKAAAAVLGGREVSSACRLWVAPASRSIMLQAVREGTLEALLAAGGLLLPPGGDIRSYTPHGKTLTTSPRWFALFPERFLLANVFIAAVAAIAGCVADPKPLCP